jgi:hypothetical protein
MEHIEPPRLLNSATQIDPLAKLPVPRNTLASIASRQRGDQLAVRFRITRGKDSDFVT